MNARPSPALAVAILALILACVGTATAVEQAKQVKAAQLAKNAVRSKTIKDGQVRPRDLAPNSVASAQIADGQVGVADLGLGSVGGEQIANGQVATSDLRDGAVETAKLATQAVTSGKLVENAVDKRVLAPGSVSTEDLVVDAVDSQRIRDGEVTRIDLAERVIDGTKLGINVMRTNSISVPAGYSRQVGVNCNLGEYPLSGGSYWGDVNDFTNNASVMSSFPTSNGWIVRATNSAHYTRTLSVVVNCLDNA